MIKRFEEYNDYGIREIDRVEYRIGINRLVNDNNFEDFTEREINEFKDIGYNVELLWSSGILLNNYISISKFRDEWFYVRVGLSERDTFPPANLGSIKYYKCDQFDSVIKILNRIYDKEV
jgi:hypothetical protein